MEKVVYNETETAKMLGLSVFTLRNWRFLGKHLPYHKIGRRVAYCESDINAFRDAGRVEPTKEA